MAPMAMIPENDAVWAWSKRYLGVAKAGLKKLPTYIKSKHARAAKSSSAVRPVRLIISSNRLIDRTP
jgi:hypothetical protein